MCFGHVFISSCCASNCSKSSQTVAGDHFTLNLPLLSEASISSSHVLTVFKCQRIQQKGVCLCNVGLMYASQNGLSVKDHIGRESKMDRG